MESIQIQIEALKSKNMKKMMLIIACMIFVYLSISIYFMNHFFLRTEINGIKVSLKGYSSTTDHIRAGIEDYQLLLVERDGTNEIIEGQEVGLHYNENNSIRRIIKHQNPFTWIYSLVKKNKYDIKDVYTYDKPALEEAIRKLHCLNQNIIEPKNVGFFYRDNTYSLVEEIYGNRLNLERLSAAVTRSLLRGERRLNLDAAHCYEEPKYKLSSLKTNQTKKLLDLYVASKIIYLFGKRNEIVDGNVIHQWLSVDENLDVSISGSSETIY